MDKINVGIIGTGWCGGIRANTCSSSPIVNELHIAEINQDRLEEVNQEVSATYATSDYRELISNKALDTIIISATPETTHYPMAKESLESGKHVFLEKPLALTLDEADELIKISSENNLKLAIGYSQRFNPKFAYIKNCIDQNKIGKPVSALVSRHITRGLGKKISSRVKLSPAAMEATHDLDFVLWCMEPAKPVRVYSQSAFGAMKEVTGSADSQWILITMDNGVVLSIGAGWNMPPGYPNYSGTWIEVLGTDGMLVVDDTHRDVIFNTIDNGIQLPMSSMPGEPLGHVFAGPMHNETINYLEAVCFDRPIMVSAEKARNVMEVYMAADISDELNEAVDLPLNKLKLSSAVA
ncbi:MAG: oxidoreductase [Gammaproteobacteria bacterium TMED78]|mgnify:FL=1|nr:MAG: oxidoreductase [Gammaproteobacteria bacterium TMED78]|tara:strand:- start:20025 stop:21083 length:1059 start_codon:yes stop_codon:yes gene_type:complete